MTLSSAAPLPGAERAGLRLVSAERRTFSGPARFLADPANRAAVSTYLSDLTRPYPPEASDAPPVLVVGEQGHSYGEMAEELIGALVPADQPVGLLVLAFSIHDVQPGRATATYLSHICPGDPMGFAICDQGSAAAFSALRIARDYPAADGHLRSLVIVVEQAALPYQVGAALPAQHRGVAMLFENGLGPATAGGAGTGGAETGRTGAGGTGASGPEAGGAGAGGAGTGGARLAALTQRPNLAPAAVAGQATADLAELSAGHPEVRLVLSHALAAAWPGHPGDGARVGPADQPSTGVWWQLLDELDAGTDRPSLLVAADYDPDLRCLCLAAIELS